MPDPLTGKLNHVQTEDSLRESQACISQLFQSHSAIRLIIDADTGKIIDANQSAVDFYGWTLEELKHMNVQEISILKSETRKKRAKIKPTSTQEKISIRHRRKNRSSREVEVFENRIVLEGKNYRYLIIHDVTERKRFQTLNDFRIHLNELSESCSVEELLRMTLDEVEELTESSIGFCHFLMDNQKMPSLQVWSTNTENHVCRMHQHEGGHPSLNESAVWFDAIKEGNPVIHNDYATLMNRNEMPEGHPFVKRELVIPVMQGKKLRAILGVGNKHSLYDDEDIRVASTLASVAWDIVARKRAEISLQNIEETLNQAQKMEMVGQLAGGIAHDYNNMLSIILGHAELALERVDSSHVTYSDLEAIQNAANRSAELTRQLLAFARKQVINPEVIELNAIVDGMLAILKRLIGEDIALIWTPETRPTRVKLDPSQVDQILVNLCINARDALTGQGRITIETSLLCNCKHNSDAHHSFALHGDYITLSVTDNGTGIDPKNLPHIFEPFFTTKQIGKGTGLGLSTVYGIVKQNQGYIECKSTPGSGTTIKVHLPCYNDRDEKFKKEEVTAVDKAKDTILLVEDEPDILLLSKKMLEQYGFTVIAASSPHDAIRIAEEFNNGIDLLITDVILPEMNGCDLSKQITSRYPQIKTLFMSGYTNDVIVHHEVLDEGINFIQKPFNIKKLIMMVKKMLKPVD
jgi:PAS domain S-box-containing protein